MTDREKEAQHVIGFKPITSRLRGMCSTTVLQSLPDNGALEIDANVRFSRLRLKILILKHPMQKIKA